MVTQEDILQFIKDNQGEPLQDFYNKTYDKLKTINQRIDKLTVYLIILAFLYLVISKATISSFSIGPVSITDISLLTIIIPFLFAWNLLDLVISSGHKSEIFATLKFIFLSRYKQEINSDDLQLDKSTLFTRILLPFSYSSEISKFSLGKVPLLTGCLGALLVIPLLPLIFVPFCFEYYMLKNVFENHYSLFIGKISFYLSIWLNLLILYYYINTTLFTFKHKKEGKLL